MTYTDEEILKKRERDKKQAYTSLEDGIYMDGQIVYFERREMFDTFSVLLPKLWKQMPKEYARIKYPSEFRPQVIVTTADLSVNMGFTQFPSKVHSGTAVQIAERAMAAIHRANSDHQIYPYEILTGKEGCWFSFRSHALDSDLYNMMLFAHLRKNILQASFNCPYADRTKWEKTVVKIWESVQELEEGIWK